MLINNYIKMYALELLRNKSAAFFTLVFPTLLLLMVGHQGDRTLVGQWQMFITMSNYTVQSSLFLALGMSIAFARASKWAEYMRTLPVSFFYPMIGQVITMLFFAVVSLFLVVAVGIIWLKIDTNFSSIIWMIIIALLGGFPMGFLGIVVAYLVNEVTARSVFVIVNLLLFFASFSLPMHGFFSSIKYFIPSYQWFSISNSVVLQKPIEFISLYGLLIYTVIFYFLSMIISKRKQ